jgi:hypothetical protein
VWSRLFPTATLADRLPRLLPTAVAVVAVRGRPGGQDRECLLAKRAPAPTNPDPVVLPVVCLLPPAPVADDRRLPAHRTPSRHLHQADGGYPGSLLSSGDGGAIKRITAGVKACRWSSRQVRSGDGPSPSCTDQCRTKKEQWHLEGSARPAHSEHGPVVTDQAGVTPPPLWPVSASAFSCRSRGKRRISTGIAAGQGLLKRSASCAQIAPNRPKADTLRSG